MVDRSGEGPLRKYATNLTLLIKILCRYYSLLDVFRQIRFDVISYLQTV